MIVLHFYETVSALLELAAKKALRPDPLRRTKRPWGGLVNDLKRRYPFYWSDFKDGMNLQTIAAAIFMYFAALSASITFGGLMGKIINIEHMVSHRAFSLSINL